MHETNTFAGSMGYLAPSRGIWDWRACGMGGARRLVGVHTLVGVRRPVVFGYPESSPYDFLVIQSICSDGLKSNVGVLTGFNDGSVSNTGESFEFKFAYFSFFLSGFFFWHTHRKMVMLKTQTLFSLQYYDSLGKEKN